MNGQTGLDSNPGSSPPAQPDCPHWFERLPLARWGWVELNVYGWPLVVAAIVLACCLDDVGLILALIPVALWGLLVYFFRDPPRQIPDDFDSIVAPADGTVVDVTRLADYEFLGGPAVRVGIFLSIFNVHINRAPLAARVVETHYRPGEFLNALNPASAERNESMWIGCETLDEPVRRFAVRQISGLLARRIVCTLVPGSIVSRGQKFGMIKLGSRTELILPADDAEVVVRVGERVRAGSDVVARWT